MVILRLAAAVLALVSISASMEALAQTPAQQVQETIKRVTAIVNLPAASVSERREAVRSLLLPRFDWNEMAKLSLGKHWPSAPERQQQFVVAFTEFVGNSYIGQIGSYKNEKIIYGDELRDSNRAEVDTKLVPANGDALSVNYRLHQIDGDWKIYDVVIADISLVSNYRSQFNRILAKTSFEDLLRQLKEKESKDRS
jgi:phospholipid transport system substrate-binding protein